MHGLYLYLPLPLFVCVLEIDIINEIQFSNTEEIEEFVKTAGQCDFDIDILYQHVYIDAKSFLGVLGLGLYKELTVKYVGQNAKFEKVLRNYAVA